MGVFPGSWALRKYLNINKAVTHTHTRLSSWQQCVVLLTLESEAEELAVEGLRGMGEAGGLWEVHTRCIMWYSSCCGSTRSGQEPKMQAEEKDEEEEDVMAATEHRHKTRNREKREREEGLVSKRPEFGHNAQPLSVKWHQMSFCFPGSLFQFSHSTHTDMQTSVCPNTQHQNKSWKKSVGNGNSNKYGLEGCTLHPKYSFKAATISLKLTSNCLNYLKIVWLKRLAGSSF